MIFPFSPSMFGLAITLPIFLAGDVADLTLRNASEFGSQGLLLVGTYCLVDVSFHRVELTSCFIWSVV
jgi:hypothetical protein